MHAADAALLVKVKLSQTIDLAALCIHDTAIGGLGQADPARTGGARLGVNLRLELCVCQRGGQ